MHEIADFLPEERVPRVLAGIVHELRLGTKNQGALATQQDAAPRVQYFRGQQAVSGSWCEGCIAGVSTR